jgi:hypothetical protein
MVSMLKQRRLTHNASVCHMLRNEERTRLHLRELDENTLFLSANITVVWDIYSVTERDGFGELNRRSL